MQKNENCSLSGSIPHPTALEGRGRARSGFCARAARPRGAGAEVRAEGSALGSESRRGHSGWDRTGDSARRAQSFLGSASLGLPLTGVFSCVPARDQALLYLELSVFWIREAIRQSPTRPFCSPQPRSGGRQENNSSRVC